MQYSLDIYGSKADLLLDILSMNCRKRRLEKGLSRKHLSEISDVPAPTIAKFEQTGKISLESFSRIADSLGYYDELYKVFLEPKYKTIEELETIQRNYSRSKGR